MMRGVWVVLWVGSRLGGMAQTGGEADVGWVLI